MQTRTLLRSLAMDLVGGFFLTYGWLLGFRADLFLRFHDTFVDCSKWNRKAEWRKHVREREYKALGLFFAGRPLCAGLPRGHRRSPASAREQARFTLWTTPAEQRGEGDEQDALQRDQPIVPTKQRVELRARREPKARNSTAASSAATAPSATTPPTIHRRQESDTERAKACPVHRRGL
jgi:hypothetical protein